MARLFIIGECPWVPSSMGKVVLWLSQELVEMGHEVLVGCYGAPTSTLWSRFTVYNPKKQCSDERFAELLPDIDIPVTLVKKGHLVEDALIYFSAPPDAIVTFGSHHAGDLGSWINDEIRNTWTRQSRPAIAYSQIDCPFEKASFALSVASYSLAAYPSEFSRSVALDGVRWLFRKRGGDSVAPRFAEHTAVVYHGIDTSIYSEKTARLVREKPKMLKPVQAPRVVGFFAKNHVRKDYAALLRCVARLRKRGLDVAAGAYFVTAVAAPVWDLAWLIEVVSRVEGVDMEGKVLVLPDTLASYGAPEPAVVETYVNLMDVHAFLTRDESFGIPPLESVMLGVPTVVSDIPPQREVWGNAMPLVRTEVRVREGWVAYEPEPEHCADVVEQVLTKGLDLSAARERVMSMFTSRHMAEQLLKATEKAFESPEPIASKVREVGEVLGIQ